MNLRALLRVAGSLRVWPSARGSSCWQRKKLKIWRSASGRGFRRTRLASGGGGLPNVASRGFWTNRVLGLHGKLATPRLPRLFVSPLRTTPENASHSSFRSMARAVGFAPRQSMGFGRRSTFSPIAPRHSSFRPPHLIVEKVRALSASNWPRLNARSFYASMKRAKCRRWTELSPCFRCALAKSSGARATVVSPLRSRMTRRGAGASTKRRGNRLRLDRSPLTLDRQQSRRRRPGRDWAGRDCRSLARRQAEAGQAGVKGGREVAAAERADRRCSPPSERSSVRRQAHTFDVLTSSIGWRLRAAATTSRAFISRSQPPLGLYRRHRPRRKARMHALGDVQSGGVLSFATMRYCATGPRENRDATCESA